MWLHDRAVSLVTCQRTGRFRFRFMLEILLQNVQTDSGTQPSSYSVGTASYFPGDKAGSARSFPSVYIRLWSISVFPLHDFTTCTGTNSSFCNAQRRWLKHCCTSRKVTGLVPDWVIWLFHSLCPSGPAMALGSTRPLTEMCTKNIFWW